MATSERFYGITASGQEFMAQIHEDEEFVKLATIDGKQHVEDIDRNFVIIKNIFVQAVTPPEQGQAASRDLQHLKDVVMTLNTINIGTVVVLPEQLVDKLKAGVSGIIT